MKVVDSEKVPSIKGFGISIDVVWPNRYLLLSSPNILESTRNCYENVSDTNSRSCLATEIITE